MRRQDKEDQPEKNLTLNVALAPSAEIKGARITARKDAGIRSTYMGAIEVPNELIANTPVVLGEKDVLKTLQMMPGVQGGNEGFREYTSVEAARTRI